MDKCVYEPFFENGGTPIRCRSLDEVEQLIQDMSTLFPEMSERLAKLKCVFGSKDKYQSEVVYRFAYYDNGGISANFCTYEFYRLQGYPIVDFSDIQAEHGNEDEDNADYASFEWEPFIFDFSNAIRVTDPSLESQMIGWD